MDKILFSHDSDHWATPEKIYNHFVNKLNYVDPCPLHCEVNNLNKDFGEVNLFINPPYSNLSSWVDFAINHHKKHPSKWVVLLIPSRTDTKYFHKLINEGIHIAFFKGRLHFNGSKNSAPFPSCLIYLGGYIQENRFTGISEKDFEEVLQ